MRLQLLISQPIPLLWLTAKKKRQSKANCWTKGKGQIERIHHERGAVEFVVFAVEFPVFAVLQHSGYSVPQSICEWSLFWSRMRSRVFPSASASTSTSALFVTVGICQCPQYISWWWPFYHILISQFGYFIHSFFFLPFSSQFDFSEQYARFYSVPFISVSIIIKQSPSPTCNEIIISRSKQLCVIITHQNNSQSNKRSNSGNWFGCNIVIFCYGFNENNSEMHTPLLRNR